MADVNIITKKNTPILTPYQELSSTGLPSRAIISLNIHINVNAVNNQPITIENTDCARVILLVPININVGVIDYHLSLNFLNNQNIGSHLIMALGGIRYLEILKLSDSERNPS